MSPLHGRGICLHPCSGAFDPLICPHCGEFAFFFEVLIPRGLSMGVGLDRLCGAVARGEVRRWGWALIALPELSGTFQSFIILVDL